VLVGLIRHAHSPMTPALGAHQILTERNKLNFAVEVIANRAQSSQMDPSSAESEHLRKRVKDRCQKLLDEWAHIASDINNISGTLQYQREVGGAQRLLYEFLSPLLADVHPRFKNFRANRSMRDVEPSVNLWMKSLDGHDVDDEESNR